jgi:hypothetical protein
MKQVESIADRGGRSCDPVNGSRQPGLRALAESEGGSTRALPNGWSVVPALPVRHSRDQTGTTAGSVAVESGGREAKRIALARWRMES